jgi:hypothetical protein
MVPMDARGLGGSPGKVGYRLAWRRMAGWLAHWHGPKGQPVGLESSRAARVRNRTAVLGGEASTDMSPDQLGATRRGGSAIQKVAMELKSPRERVLVAGTGPRPGRASGVRREGWSRDMLFVAVDWSPHEARDARKRIGPKATTSRARFAFLGGG